ncbi:hypothetical protein Tco_1402125 [Tanacetum coccineum]
MENGLAIHMLTEKKYPLSQELLSKMLSKKLEVDHESSQAFELLSSVSVIKLIRKDLPFSVSCFTDCGVGVVEVDDAVVADGSTAPFDPTDLEGNSQLALKQVSGSRLVRTDLGWVGKRVMEHIDGWGGSMRFGGMDWGREPGIAACDLKVDWNMFNEISKRKVMAILLQVVISDCKVEREKYDAEDYHTNSNNDEDDDESDDDDDVEEYDSDMDTTNVAMIRDHACDLKVDWNMFNEISKRKVMAILLQSRKELYASRKWRQESDGAKIGNLFRFFQVVISDCKVEREKYDAEDYHTNSNNDEDDNESDDVEEYDSDMDTTNVNEALLHLPISRNSVYANVVEKVTEAFEVQQVLMIDCARVGMNDCKRIAVKLRGGKKDIITDNKLS